MKQERRIIAMDEYGKIHFPNNSNNIWMSANELIEHIQKRYPKRTRSAKVFQTIQWQQYGCLLTAFDYCFVFSVGYIGGVQDARVYHKQTHNQSENRHCIFERAYARICE